MKATTLNMDPDKQMEHGLSLIRDYERSAAAVDEETKEQYLAAGIASCFTALWRLQRNTGPCGSRAAAIGGHDVVCLLDYGHAGTHKSEEGTAWRELPR